MMLLRSLVTPTDHLGEELAEEIREKHPNGIGSPRAQAPPDRAWSVAEFARSILHSATCPVFDRSDTVKDPGDRGGRDTRPTRNILDGHAHDLSANSSPYTLRRKGKELGKGSM